MSLISTDTFKNLFSEGLLFKKQIIFHMKNDRTEHFCTTIILNKTGHHFAIMCKSAAREKLVIYNIFSEIQS